jgi:hypothetical protein
MEFRLCNNIPYIYNMIAIVLRIAMAHSAAVD